MTLLAAFALMSMPFPIPAAQAQSLAERAGLYNNLFDAGRPVKMQPFAMDQDIPKIPETVAVQAPAGPAEQPQAQPQPDARQALLDFRKLYGGKILQVPGVLGVMVGEDCGLKFPHVHIRPHMPALVVTLDGKVPEEQVRADLLARVPELAKVKYRFEVGDPRTADPDELRNWLQDRPKALAPVRS